MNQAFPAPIFDEKPEIATKIREKPKYKSTMTNKLDRIPKGIPEICWIDDKERRNI
jgi:hypothetical protein